MELIQYIKHSYYELVNKVSWLKPSELQKTTVTVTIASLIFALLVFVIDQIVKFGIDSYIEFFFKS